MASLMLMITTYYLRLLRKSISAFGLSLWQSIERFLKGIMKFLFDNQLLPVRELSKHNFFSAGKSDTIIKGFVI